MDDPLALVRASQKLIAVVTLIRAIPEPSTPEGRNLRREAQALVEQATVQQAESSSSCMRHQSSARTDGGKRDQEESDHTPSRGMAVPARPTNKGKTPSIHDCIQKRPVKERVLDRRGKDDDGDARNVLSKKKQDAATTPGYHT